LKGNDISDRIKTQSEKDWVKGYVKIFDSKVKLNNNSYRKRNKVFSNNKWIDTRAIIINEKDKSLVVYKAPELNLVLNKVNKEYSFKILLKYVFVGLLFLISYVFYTINTCCCFAAEEDTYIPIEVPTTEVDLTTEYNVVEIYKKPSNKPTIRLLDDTGWSTTEKDQDNKDLKEPLGTNVDYKENQFSIKEDESLAFGRLAGHYAKKYGQLCEKLIYTSISQLRCFLNI